MEKKVHLQQLEESTRLVGHDDRLQTERHSLCMNRLENCYKNYHMTRMGQPKNTCGQSSTEAKKLPEERAQLFHHIVAHLQYFCRTTQQDIQTSVVKDNQQKLTSVVQYIRGTQDIVLTIEPDDNPQWWVEISYAVHPDK